MRSFSVLIAVLSATLLGPDAAAQDNSPSVTGTVLSGRPAAGVVDADDEADAAPGKYGGGFIELLLTGRDPTRHGRAPSARLAALPTADAQWEIDPRYRRQTVPYGGPQKPGTIVIDTPSRFLYLVQPGGSAIRYGIGVGRPGFEWAGVKSVSMMRPWPEWRPPAEMLKRRPDLPRYMAGGLENPLGARAIYLGSSLYRIHGTNEPHTIGHAVSSGCIRMLNEDVVDLYERVRVGTQVLVL